MPLYEYQCQVCQVKFEELVNSSEKVIVCPDCKSEKVNKLLSVFSASVNSSSSGSSLPCGQKSCNSGFS